MSGIRLPMRVWDLPTRLFHWGILLAAVTSYVSIKLNWMQTHFFAGYTMITLLLFRLAWGLIGSDTARFARFLKGPAAVTGYLRHLFRPETDNQVGHNPAGGWMVMLLLLAMAVQAATGLFSNDDVLFEGPLAHLAGKPLSNRISGIHSFNVNICLTLIGLHVLAVILYRFIKKQDLIGPMISGKKKLPGATPAPRMRSPVLALIVLLCAAGVTWGITQL
jgi:cytochrome b